MTYTSTTRDRYRLAVWTATAAVAAGAITATGWVAGAAAQDQAEDDSARQAEQDALARQEYDAWLARYGEQQARTRTPRTVVRQRPVRTRITTRYVTATSPTASVGAGGTLGTSSTPSTSTTSQQAGSSGNGNQPQPQVQTPPPPPPPPPAPTSGS